MSDRESQMVVYYPSEVVRLDKRLMNETVRFM